MGEWSTSFGTTRAMMFESAALSLRGSLYGCSPIATLDLAQTHFLSP